MVVCVRFLLFGSGIVACKRLIVWFDFMLVAFAVKYGVFPTDCCFVGCVCDCFVLRFVVFV